MAQDPEQTAAQLTKATARLEDLAKRRRGGGPLGGFRPFVLGALVGAGAALLYAPQAGEQTRALLRRNASELQESATQSAQTAKEKIQGGTAKAQGTAQQALAQASDKVKATVANGRAKTDAVVEDAKEAVQDSDSKIQAATDTAADKATGVQQAAARKAPQPQAS